MKPAPFDYYSPRTIQEAVELLSEFGETAKVLAGGQSLIPMLALRLAMFDQLIDIGQVAELNGLERRNGGLWVGAGTRQATLEASPDVADAVPLLARATPLIGHFQIRNRGTVGGSIAHADASAELPAVVLALDATLHVLSPAGPRTIAAAEFFTGYWTTTLATDELLVGVTFPTWTGRTGFAVQEFARRYGDFAIAGAAVGLELDGDDRVRRLAIGLMGLGPTPERGRAAEADVVGKHVDEVVPEELGRLAMSDLAAVTTDLHGSADYRKRVGATVVGRAWTAAMTEARNV